MTNEGICYAMDGIELGRFVSVVLTSGNAHFTKLIKELPVKIFVAQ